MKEDIVFRNKMSVFCYDVIETDPYLPCFVYGRTCT